MTISYGEHEPTRHGSRIPPGHARAFQEVPATQEDARASSSILVPYEEAVPASCVVPGTPDHVISFLQDLERSSATGLSPALLPGPLEGERTRSAGSPASVHAHEYYLEPDQSAIDVYAEEFDQEHVQELVHASAYGLQLDGPVYVGSMQAATLDGDPDEAVPVHGNPRRGWLRSCNE